MHQSPFQISPEACIQATARSSRIEQDIDAQERDIDARQWTSFRDLAKRELATLRSNVREDPKRDRRLSEQLCIRCMYSSRIGGAAVTTRPCGLCLVDQGFGSTATDVLCQSCATDHALCKRCGGDLEGRVERTDYPSSPTG